MSVKIAEFKRNRFNTLVILTCMPGTDAAKYAFRGNTFKVTNEQLIWGVSDPKVYEDLKSIGRLKTEKRLHKEFYYLA